jgi:hypothetical protein
VATGGLELDGTLLSAGDGAGIRGQRELEIARALSGTELVLFDLP